MIGIPTAVDELSYRLIRDLICSQEKFAEANDQIGNARVTYYPRT